MAALVSESNGVKLDSVVQTLCDFIRDSQIPLELLAPVSRSFATFHPDADFPVCLPKPADATDQIADFERSLSQLERPECVLDELINVMERHPEGDFACYPEYLRRILQIAWSTMLRIPPPNADDDIWILVAQAQEQIARVPEGELPVSEFGAHALQRKFMMSRVA
jgi:hypothetical protein